MKKTQTPTTYQTNSKYFKTEFLGTRLIDQSELLRLNTENLDLEGFFQQLKLYKDPNKS